MTSIRRQLTLGLVCGIAILLLAGGAALFFVARSFLRAEFDSALKAKSAALASLVQLMPNGTVELEFAEEFMPAFQRQHRPEYFQVWRGDGTTLERSPSLGARDLPKRSGQLTAPRVWNLDLPDGRPGRAIGVQFFPSSDAEENDRPESVALTSAAPVTLVVAQDRIALERTTRTLMWLLLGMGALTVPGIMLVVNAVVKRGLEPLNRVADQAAAINASSLASRFSTAAMPRELLPIGERLNDLLARLQSAFARERRFTADVAHELRTPVAELRSLAKVALKWPGADAGATEGFRDALAIAIQMESVVVRLLELVRCEDERKATHPESIRLSEFVGEAWKAYAAEAAAKELSVELEIPDAITLSTDRTMLGAILRNLLANAVEYTPARGRIRVAAGVVDRATHLTLANSVEDLTETDVANFRERFWRKNLAREDSHHSGLGLSIAHEFSRLLGMSLIAELPSASTLVMTLRWPCSESSAKADPSRPLVSGNHSSEDPGQISPGGHARPGLEV